MAKIKKSIVEKTAETLFALADDLLDAVALVSDIQGYTRPDTIDNKTLHATISKTIPKLTKQIKKLVATWPS